MATRSLDILINAKDRTGKGIASVKQRLSRASADIARIGTRVATAGLFALAAAGTAAAASVGGLTKQSLAHIDATAKTADVLGLTTEQLAAYQHMAGRSGATTKELDTAFRRLQKNISDGTKGLTTANRAFEDLGLSAEQLERLSPDEQMQAVADALGNLDSQAKRARVAQDLFGRSGLKMLKVLEQGSEGIRRARVEAEKLNLTFSREEAARVEAANDAWTDFRSSMRGIGIEIAIAAAGPLKEVADWATDFAVDVGDLVEVVNTLGGGFEGLGKIGKASINGITIELLNLQKAAIQFAASPVGSALFGSDSQGFLDFLTSDIDQQIELLRQENEAFARLLGNIRSGTPAGESDDDGGGAGGGSGRLALAKLASGRLLQGNRGRESSLETIAKEQKRIAEQQLEQEKATRSGVDAMRAFLQERLPVVQPGGEVQTF